MNRSYASFALLVLLLVASSVVSGADWGDLTMTFKYDGKAPTPKPITPDKDLQVCGKVKLIDETLLVNSSNNGIANVIVWLSVEKGTKVPVHESYAASEKSDVILDNNVCVFKPHIVLLRPTQTLIVKNSDACGHNTNIMTTSNPGQNVTVVSNSDVKQTFKNEERLPAPVQCNIHPWMKSWLLIKDTPYMAVSDADGKVELKNLPAGKWSFQVYHEGCGYVREVTIAGKSVKWARGKIDNQAIKSGNNDMGEVKVPAKLFEKS